MNSLKLDDSILNECLRTFTYGTDNELEAKIQEGDGLGVYWALMSMFRPLSDIWKEDVERYITSLQRRQRETKAREELAWQAHHRAMQAWADMKRDYPDPETTCNADPAQKCAYMRLHDALYKSG